ncbi:MAG TPA: proline--tRNA ligase, partial [Isosphaeraceae bacterium]|nr:proline--tRNA ligase [Isosphaeraceae bacterium]
DAYSIDADLAQLNQSYGAMYEAYCRIFDRCALPYVIVEAESGPIGGDSSHEFMVPCATGEDKVIQCPSCGYAANQERAEAGAPKTFGSTRSPADAPPYEAVATPNKRTIRDVCQFLGVEEATSAKLLVYLADGQPVAALLRGDHGLNESKLRRTVGAAAITPADAATIEKTTGAPMGFLGPVAIKIPLVIDHAIASMPTVVVGGNALDVHLKGVVPGRDFPLQRVYDLRNAEAGDTCPRCGAALEIKSGLEIGHVFKLGTKYSKSMGANYLDEKGKEVLFIMGCYGIGINRIVAAAVEAGHDDNGIIWPLSLAPYHVEVIPLQVQNAAVIEQSLALEKSLTAAGLDVLVDDRDQRPGFKFKDADLIGIPLRVVVGERGLKDGTVEMKWRAQGEPKLIPAASATQLILAEIDEVRKRCEANCQERRQARAAPKGA